MKISISDVEKISKESGLKEIHIIELLNAEIVPGIQYSQEEISKLSRLAMQKNDAWWKDAMSVC